MKIRQGFVSNSSSSSFVILLPENFDVEKHVNDNWSKFDSYSIGDLLDEIDEDEIESEDFDEVAFSKAKVKEIIEQFIIDGSVDGYDSSTNMYIVNDVLNEYVIADMDVSSDSGCGQLADVNKIKSILGV